jgi:hypothetical protein
MSITKYNKNSLLFEGERYEWSNKLKTLRARWNSSANGFLVPKEYEDQLRTLVEHKMSKRGEKDEQDKPIEARDKPIEARDKPIEARDKPIEARDKSIEARDKSLDERNETRDRREKAMRDTRDKPLDERNETRDRREKAMRDTRDKPIEIQEPIDERNVRDKKFEARERDVREIKERDVRVKPSDVREKREMREVPIEKRNVLETRERKPREREPVQSSSEDLSNSGSASSDDDLPIRDRSRYHRANSPVKRYQEDRVREHHVPSNQSRYELSPRAAERHLKKELESYREAPKAIRPPYSDYRFRGQREQRSNERIRSPDEDTISLARRMREIMSRLAELESSRK